MYKLTLIMDDEAMAERLLNDYGRGHTFHSVREEGCGLIRDYGAVLGFEHIGFEHEARVLHGGGPLGPVEAPLVTTILLGNEAEEAD